jgi:hypothetical protein
MALTLQGNNLRRAVERSSGEALRGSGKQAESNVLHTVSVYKIFVFEAPAAKQSTYFEACRFLADAGLRDAWRKYSVFRG